MPTQTADGQQTVEGIYLELAAMLAGDLTGAKLHLYKSTFSPTPNNVEADFAANECDFTGYAAETLTWSAPGHDAGNNPVAYSDAAFFQATDAVSPNTVGGCYITKDTVGPPAVHTVLEFYPFNPTIPMTTALASMSVTVAMGLPGSNGYASVDS